MKTKIIILFCLIFNIYFNSYATNNYYKTEYLSACTIDSTYEQNWQKVEDFKNKELPKSALKIVNDIYKKAKEENNASQFVKAVLYKINLKSKFEENYLKNTINELNNEIEASNQPIKQILYSTLAEVYWKYYQTNRYKFLNRTETINFKKDDIETWTLKDITRYVIAGYLNSLKNADKLKKTSLKTYDNILLTEKKSKNYRPTLYDFLAHRAVDFFKNKEPEIIRPAYKFELNNKDYFKYCNLFTKVNIATNDSMSLKFYGIKILQDLIMFHLNDKNPQALIDVDLERLKFVKDNSIIEQKDSLYLNALQIIEKKFNKFSISTNISYEIANEYYQKAKLYRPLESENHKWDLKTSYQYCEKAIKRFPDSNAEGVKNCLCLQEKIKQTSINITTEYVNIPDKPFRALVSYKNISNIYIKIIKYNYTKDKNLKRKFYNKELVDKYKNMPDIKQWNLTLSNDSDFQKHSVEIKIPGLDLGYYIILIGTDKKFSYDNESVAYFPFWVSNISYISRPEDNNDLNFYVLNRETGTGMKNVSAQIYYNKYDYKLKKTEQKKGEKFTTNEQGHFSMSSANRSPSRFYIEFVYKKDTLITNSFYQSSRHLQKDRTVLKTFFFTDRAIYRPGQTIYFKGILLEKNSETYHIKPKCNTTVTFYDVNSRKIADLKLISNEYGTFNGTFTTPVGVLNGRMFISNSSGSIGFLVEEYKRPKFEVLFNPVKETYKLNEIVTITGNAKAFSGNNISNSKVKYRVVRASTFPYWRYWRPIYPYNLKKTEITNGITNTDAQGEFTINFKAIPDLTIPRKNKPVFNYTVYADVTDINGETHSNQKTISVGYTGLIINVDIPDKIDKDKKNEFKIIATNLDGEKQAAKGEITIYKLKQPDRIFRERQWDRPDKFSMTKQEFYNTFTYDIYDNENDIHNRKKEINVLEYAFDTEKDSLLKLNKISKYEQGHYVLEIKSKDKYGTDVKSTNYFTVYSLKNKQIPDNSINWFTMLKEKGEPGEKISFLIGTKDKNVNILYEIEHKKKIIFKQWINISNKQKLIEIPIKEEYRGNFSIHLTFIKHNRSFDNTETIIIPYTNKNLDITFETFRDKLSPGQKEEWNIKIKDNKSEKIAAEMLATLYDASLDKFKKNIWTGFDEIYKSYYSSLNWNIDNAFTTNRSNLYTNRKTKHNQLFYHYYDKLNWFGFNYYASYTGSTGGRRTRVTSMMSKGIKHNKMPETTMDEGAIPEAEPDMDKEISTAQDKQSQTSDFTGIQIRRNFNETAFFYPDLKTNDKDEIIISFTVPESLTKWKLMALAHTKDLKYGQIQKQLITQKKLMIIPNIPRFFRQGDKISLCAKVSNISENNLQGQAKLLLFDATTMKPVNDITNNNDSIKDFSVQKQQNTILCWNITVPDNIEAITYRIVAKSGNFSDGEEKIIPVLTNRMLVTESLPLPVNGKQTKKFTFTKLLNSKSSSTLKNHKLTLEYTSNPAWYAVQSLPYLMETPYECSEQIFSRLYANSIASYIVNSNPKIKQVFECWKNFTPDALLSNLEKNQELKTLILKETPWFLDAKNESQRKQRIALLFDANKMSNELNIALSKLIKMQSYTGAWPWFKGMSDSRYITQYIITGFGHLDNIGIKNVKKDQKIWQMIRKSVRYLDAEIMKDYQYIQKYNPDNMDKNHISRLQIQYLYARSYFINDIKIQDRYKQSFEYFKNQAKKYWTQNNIHLQAMLSLALNRYGDNATAMDIIKSLKEKSIHSDEMGMYWRDTRPSYYWYQAPVETQALMIEAFDKVANDDKSVEELKIWLLKQKQTQDWKTSKATAEACYALLLRGANILESSDLVNVSLNDIKINPKEIDDVKVEAGTGYFKTSWSGSDIKPQMGNVTVTKSDDGVAWGALYWQYFEQLDKITPHQTPLKLEKKLFIEKNTPSGPVIEPITEKTELKLGDKIKVRIELRVDRDMEYVHMKDMRASGFEPINVISKYKYQDGLGYYESTGDAATNFFFSYLKKGTYVFEYPLLINNKGDFSNGITTVQCMYAPEFTAHSQGVRVKISK